MGLGDALASVKITGKGLCSMSYGRYLWLSAYLRWSFVAIHSLGDTKPFSILFSISAYLVDDLMGASILRASTRAQWRATEPAIRKNVIINKLEKTWLDSPMYSSDRTCLAVIVLEI